MRGVCLGPMRLVVVLLLVATALAPVANAQGLSNSGGDFGGTNARAAQASAASAANKDCSGWWFHPVSSVYFYMEGARLNWKRPPETAFGSR